MLLSLLSETQKDAFVALAYRVVLADHEVPEPEQHFFELVKATLGMGKAVTPEMIMGSPELSAFDSRRARVAALVALLCLAYSDNNFHVNESGILLDLAKSFGLSSAEFKTLEESAKSYLNTLRAVERMI